MAVGGVALLLVTQPRAAGGLEFAGWGAVLLVLGGDHLWRRGGVRRQRVLLLAGTGLLVLAPAVLSASTGGVFTVAQSLTVEMAQVVVMLGVVALGLGLAGGRDKTSEDQTAIEPFGEIAVAVGASLPLLVLAAGLALFGGLPSTTGAAIVLGQLLIVSLSWYLLRRSDQARMRAVLTRLRQGFTAVASRSAAVARRLAVVGLDAVHLVGAVIEGRAALLWVLVVVLALAVSTGGV